MDFLSAKQLKNKQGKYVTFILHFYYGYVKDIDFFENKGKIKVDLNYYDEKRKDVK